ncbi:hypothetical protein PsorP6_015308 [Peronosclerospora sorghi]|uniref:Uncharacterized protein n=1 Tax=Peronosclerospora sorghi TaxID=230839 RepID=A0ACC0VSG7_9STRA|nr:hypothetical protein PsorP6_015308 [Peronosclerospora sorghi]
MGDKYDRQLRLWGAEGQARLARTHVLVLGSSATGSEALKNLVLPGIQRFTIVDDQVVTLADATNNFFVTADAVGKSRAETVAHWMCEMNPDVTGSARHARIRDLVAHEPAYLTQFDVIVATQLDEKTSRDVAAICWSKHVPLLLVTSYGFLGSVRVQVADHVIYDTQVDPPRVDLRLAQPFPALEAFVDRVDVAGLAPAERIHVPFVVLLLHCLKQYKQRHAGDGPRTVADKKAMIHLIHELVPASSLNAREAVDHVAMTCVASSVPDQVAHVLAVASTHVHAIAAFEPGNETHDFWLLAHALALFVAENDNCLPVAGVVPDMSASTTWYVALQDIYTTKAAQDARQVDRILRQELATLQLDRDRIPFERVAAFCAKASSLALFETRSVAQEYEEVDGASFTVDDDDLDDDKAQSPGIWYLMLRAVASFVSTFGRYPGADERATPDDETWLVTQAKALAPATPDHVRPTISPAHAQEMTRSCQVELHTIAAVMGGVAAQEAVKLITHQFEPLNHTYFPSLATPTSILPFSPSHSKVTKKTPHRNHMQADVAAYFDALLHTRLHSPPIRCDVEQGKGKALFAAKALKAGDPIWTEAPFVAMQHEDNKAFVTCCDNCFVPLIDRKVCWERVVARNGSVEVETEVAPADEPADASAADFDAAIAFLQQKGGKSPHESYFAVFHLTETLVRCTCGAFYCSRTCQEIAYAQHHALLCPHEHARETAMRRFVHHTLVTNEIFQLAAKVLAKIVLRYVATQDLAHARQPVDMFCNLPWCQVVTSENDLEEGETFEAYREKFRSLLRQTFDHLMRGLEENLAWLETRGELHGLSTETVLTACDPVLNVDFFSRVMGMFEMNNISMEIDHPFHALGEALSETSPEEKQEMPPVLARVKAALEKFTAEHKSRLEDESAQQGDDDDDDDRDEMDALAQDFVGVEGTALFSGICTMNHSCDPNCTVLYTKDGAAHVFAVQDIAEGNELCISYIDVDQEVDEREQELREYQFVCHCARCEDERKLA